MHELDRIKASVHAKSLLKIWDIWAYCLALHCCFFTLQITVEGGGGVGRKCLQGDPDG